MRSRSSRATAFSSQETNPFQNLCVCACVRQPQTHTDLHRHTYTHTLSPPAHILVSLAQEALGNRPYSKKFVCHDIGNKSLIGEINDRVALAVLGCVAC